MNNENFEDTVFALDDFTESQLENLRGRLPQEYPFERHGNWYHFGKIIDNSMSSGWKLHIPGAHIAHSVYLYENLDLVVLKWRALAKVGGEEKAHKTVIPGYMIIPGHVDWGKSGATIYVPPSVFKHNHLQEFVDDILGATLDYHCEITPLCTKHLCGNLYYRYELDRPCDITVGVPHSQYREYYTVANPDTPYKPDDVIDPFLTLTLPG